VEKEGTTTVSVALLKVTEPVLLEVKNLEEAAPVISHSKVLPISSASTVTSKDKLSPSVKSLAVTLIVGVTLLILNEANATGIPNLFRTLIAAVS